MNESKSAIEQLAREAAERIAGWYATIMVIPVRKSEIQVVTNIITDTFAAAPSQYAEWQPIETAPKGDDEILLYSPNGDIAIATWREDAQMWDADFGWVLTNPTHWMPLPVAPALTTTPRECEWKSSCDPDFDVWETSCGELFQFETDGPTENKMKFCCYCGKVLIAIVSRDSEA